MKKDEKKSISRRKFLIRSGIGLAGASALLYFGCTPIRRAIGSTAAEMDLPSGILSFDTDLWFTLEKDNTLTIRSPKVEMGQGIFTGLAMLVAEELDMDMQQIKVIHASTQNGAADFAGTGGSSTTTSLYVDLREMAATLRETIKQAASKQLNIPTDQLITKSGKVIYANGEMTYSEIALKSPDWKIAKTPELRPEKEFKIIGTSQKRVDLEDKVLGKPIYGIDVDLPEMVYGQIVYSPFLGGKMGKVDTKEAQKVKGVLTIHQDKEWIGVVAKNQYAALKAAKLIQVDWQVAKKATNEEIIEAITVGKGTHVNIQDKGNVERTFTSTTNAKVTAAYRTPPGIHATMEPSVSVASVEGDNVTIYMGTQMAQIVKGQITSKTRFKSDNINIQPTMLGGGFGRKATLYNVVEAITLSDKVKKPVKVIWTREQEFQNGYLRPNTHHALRGSVTKTGEIESFQHEQATGDMILQNFPPIALKALGADMFSAGHGARIPYIIPNKKADMWQNVLPYPTGIWRSVGMFSNTFAVECFVDELAHAAKKDPIEFRINHLQDDDNLVRRRKELLVLLAQKAGWDTPKKPGVGRGIATGEDRKAIAATMVELEVVEGQIRIIRVVQLLDSGKIVNPDGARQQVEGATIMALSAALFEDVSIEDGQISATNFHQYNVAKLAHTPQIEVYFHEGGEKPYGVGEPPMAPVAPAIANALFDLTGKRFRSLPLQPAFTV